MKLRKVILSAVMLMMACVMQAVECPTGLKIHLEGSGELVHFNWDCYDLNLNSADEAVKQVWDYISSIYTLNSKDQIPQLLRQHTSSSSGTVHYFYGQGRLNVISVATRDGRPYFLTGGLGIDTFSSSKAQGDNSVQEVKTSWNALIPEGSPAVRVVDGETVSSSVNTMYYGPQTINYTKQDDKVVLYDGKRKIYAFASNENDILPIYEGFESDTVTYLNNYDKWSHHLPLVSDNSTTAFAGDEYSDYQPCLQGFSFLSSDIASQTITCAVITAQNDTLTTGSFALDTIQNKYVCKFEQPLAISKYDLRLSLHVKEGGYQDADVPMYILGTGGLKTLQFTLGKYVTLNASFAPDDSTSETLSISTLLPSYTLIRKQPYLDAYWGMQKVVDFYHDVFGYDSFDNCGTPTYLFINGSPDYLREATPFNAGAKLGQGYGVMFFGMGMMTAYHCRARSLPLTDLVVMGHEFTHLVESYSPAGGFSYAEGGALDESFADIMGACIEAYTLGTDEPTYSIGTYNIKKDADVSQCSCYNDFITKNMQSSVRRMDDTTLCSDTLPTVYKGAYWLDGDAHINCGVQDHWFYLLVKKVGLKVARELCFAELSLYHTLNSDYPDIYEVAKAAAKYHGIDGTSFGDETSNLYNAVLQTWKECGLDDTVTGIYNVTNHDDSTIGTALYNLSGQRVNANTKGILIRGGKKYISK